MTMTRDDSSSAIKFVSDSRGGLEASNSLIGTKWYNIVASHHDFDDFACPILSVERQGADKLESRISGKK